MSARNEKKNKEIENSRATVGQRGSENATQNHRAGSAQANQTSETKYAALVAPPPVQQRIRSQRYWQCGGALTALKGGARPGKANKKKPKSGPAQQQKKKTEKADSQHGKFTAADATQENPKN